jgi:CheY-like chemotaxis protein
VARILAVDDDPVNRLLLRHTLTLLGHEVVPADGVGTARPLVSAGGFDLIVSDLQMPDGCGLDLAELAGPARFVLLTGLPPALRRAHPGYAAVDAVLAKPVGSVELGECVERLLAGRSG